MAEAAQNTQPIVQYLTFNLGGEEYGISLSMVQEIVSYVPVNKVPTTPSWIRGVFNLRGKVLPLIDLRVRFGEQASAVTKRTCVLILNVHVEELIVPMGLVVDYVKDVLDLEPGMIEPPPVLGTRIKTAFITGLFKRGSQVLCLLDVERVFSEEELLFAARSHQDAAQATNTSAGQKVPEKPAPAPSTLAKAGLKSPISQAAKTPAPVKAVPKKSTDAAPKAQADSEELVMPNPELGFHFFDDE